MKKAIILSLMVIAAGSAGTAEPASRAAADKVDVRTYDWRDVSRDRPVPVKIYSPGEGRGPWPVILFSHGLGGSRDGYEYLGRYWAEHGYVSVHLQHVGSDDSVWRGQPEPMAAMRRAAAELKNAVHRPLDVSFAIDQLEKLNAEDGPFKGRLDLKHIGMAGHSFGAFTTLAVAGQVFRVGGRERSFTDPRIKAAIAMSAPLPGDKSERGLDIAFGKIAIPCFHMTGTKDFSLIGATTPQQRRLPFDHCRRSDQYLLTFTGGDHMVFAGVRRKIGGEKDAEFQELIRESSTAFWDAYLKGDTKAKAWLADGAFEKKLAGLGTFEKKRPVGGRGASS